MVQNPLHGVERLPSRPEGKKEEKNPLHGVERGGESGGQQATGRAPGIHYMELKEAPGLRGLRQAT